MICPNCDSISITKLFTNYEWLWGDVKLITYLPYYICSKCNFQYLDNEGMQAKEDSILGYLSNEPEKLKRYQATHPITKRDV